MLKFLCIIIPLSVFHQDSIYSDRAFTINILNFIFLSVYFLLIANIIIRLIRFTIV